MMLAFSLVLLRPEWMLVLLAAPVLAWLALRGRKARPRAGDVAAIAARAVMLLAVALALSLPRVEFRAEFRAVAFLLDVSDSIPRGEPFDRARDFVARASSARGKDDDASFLVLADGAAVEVPMSRISASQRMESVVIDPRNVATRLSGGETDLEAALRLARAGFPPGGARRVVLVTDGNETRGDALAAAKDLLAEGIDVQVVPVRYERERECWVEKVVAPSHAPENAPIPIRVMVSSTHDGVAARVRCLVDGVEVAREDATLSAGRNTFQLGYSFEDAGFHRIEAILEPSVDGNPANNRGAAATQVRGKGRILVVSAAEGSPLADELRKGLEVAIDAGGPEILPDDPGGWVPYDAVVLENVASFAMSEVQRRVLASAVREMGVGIVCVGGPNVYAPGGYGGTELDEILPLSSEVSNKRVLPSGALVICLHSCEFPDGNAAGREVSKAAIRALSSDDEIGILQWTWGDEWVIPLQRVGDKNKKCQLADQAEPSDMPSFDSSLELAAEALAESKAAAKHILIISDGDPAPPNDRLVTRIVDDLRVSVSTVCVDPHGGEDSQRVMKDLAERSGGNFYIVKSADRGRLPQIFIKEAVTVRRSAWREEPFQPQVAGVHRMLQDIDVAALPPLRGHTVTTLKPQAELILVGPDDDPVLATWRHGLAQATAWTSDASPRWAADWVSWPGYGRFWSQVVRTSLRAVERPGTRVSTDVESGSAHVVLDALRPDGSFENGLRVGGRVVRPDGAAEDFRLSQTGPGRYEGSFPASSVGTYLATLTWTDPAAGPDAPKSQALAGVCVAYSAEHLAQRSNERLFATLEGAGATLLDLGKLDAEFAADPSKPDPATLPWGGVSGSTSDPLELWPWIAGLAALILVVDVAIRRVRVPWAKLLPKRKPAAARPGPAIVVAKGTARAPAQGAFDASAPPPEAAKDLRPAGDPGAPKAPPPASDSGDSLRAVKDRAKRKQTWEEN